MGIGHAHRSGFEVTQHRPHDRQRTGSAARARIAPAAASRSRTRSIDTARTAPPAVVAASAAAVPAAWPIAMHWAIERTEAWASWVAEKQRPATRTLIASRTTRVRYGMPTAEPS